MWWTFTNYVSHLLVPDGAAGMLFVFDASNNDWKIIKSCSPERQHQNMEIIATFGHLSFDRNDFELGDYDLLETIVYLFIKKLRGTHPNGFRLHRMWCKNARQKDT